MDSLPPPPLRLLPAGTTSCRVGISPTEKSKPYTTHALAGAKDIDPEAFRPCRGSFKSRFLPGAALRLSPAIFRRPCRGVEGE